MQTTRGDVWIVTMFTGVSSVSVRQELKHKTISYLDLKSAKGKNLLYIGWLCGIFRIYIRYFIEYQASKKC